MYYAWMTVRLLGQCKKIMSNKQSGRPRTRCLNQLRIAVQSNRLRMDTDIRGAFT